MYFDVPKVVQSPGYDCGHDEESRNGRDVKIHILDDMVFPERQESHSDSRTKRHNPWRLDHTPWARVSDVWPLTSAKLSFAPTYSPMGLTPWPNHIIQYMNLYLRTIPELLVMSVISSGTPNNIQSPTYITHIILYRQRNVKRADPTGSRTM